MFLSIILLLSAIGAFFWYFKVSRAANIAAQTSKGASTVQQNNKPLNKDSRTKQQQQANQNIKPLQTKRSQQSQNTSKIPFLVLYASQTGTSASLSGQFADQATKEGFDVKVEDMRGYTGLKVTGDEPQLKPVRKSSQGSVQRTLPQLTSDTLVVMFLSNTGQGEPPEGMKKLMNWMETAVRSKQQANKIDQQDSIVLFNRNKQQSIASLDSTIVPKESQHTQFPLFHYTIFGLGNTQYQHFNRTAKHTNKLLKYLGATQIHPTGLGDNNACMEDDYEKWKKGLWGKLKEVGVKLEGKRVEGKKVEQKKGEQNESNNNKNASEIIGNSTESDSPSNNTISNQYPPQYKDDQSQPQHFTIIAPIFKRDYVSPQYPKISPFRLYYTSEAVQPLELEQLDFRAKGRFQKAIRVKVIGIKEMLNKATNFTESQGNMMPNFTKDRSTILLTLQPITSTNYPTGCNIAIYPLNPKKQIDQVTRIWQLSETNLNNSSVNIEWKGDNGWADSSNKGQQNQPGSKRPATVAFQLPTTLRKLLERQIDLTSKPSKSQMRKLLQFGSKQLERLIALRELLLKNEKKDGGIIKEREMEEFCKTVFSGSMNNANVNNYSDINNLNNLTNPINPNRYQQTVPPTLIDLISHCFSQSPPFPLQDFLSLTQSQSARLYTVASHSQTSDGLIHLIVSRVRGGLISQGLDRWIKVGEEMEIEIRKSGFESGLYKNDGDQKKGVNKQIQQIGQLQIPQPLNQSLPQSRWQHVIFVAAGTGLAPFIGFLQEKQYWMNKQKLVSGNQGNKILSFDKVESGSNNITNPILNNNNITNPILNNNNNYKHPKITLFFGCRRPQQDLIFCDQLKRWHQIGVLDQLVVAFSRVGSDKVWGDGRGRNRSIIICNEKIGKVWKLVKESLIDIQLILILYPLLLISLYIYNSTHLIHLQPYIQHHLQSYPIIQSYLTNKSYSLLICGSQSMGRDVLKVLEGRGGEIGGLEKDGRLVKELW